MKRVREEGAEFGERETYPRRSSLTEMGAEPHAISEFVLTRLIPAGIGAAAAAFGTLVVLAHAHGSIRTLRLLHREVNEEISRLRALEKPDPLRRRQLRDWEGLGETLRAVLEKERLLPSPPAPENPPLPRESPPPVRD